MNKKKNFLCFLAFVPQILLPTGVYFEGDKSILSIKIPEGNSYEYRVPEDNKGGCIHLNENQNNPFFYM
uniref:Uncharacterized protein n=1 Tax=Cliftonaea pectinata TaxID=2007206 RepID=A0A1Z1MPY6_9FLOR|nr:hypothetical protein [Cliftonaea pectinata]ARW68153.1 hypothetical protein [Cliftonaea pectinata]